MAQNTDKKNHVISLLFQYDSQFLSSSTDKHNMRQLLMHMIEVCVLNYTSVGSREYAV